MNSVVLSGRLVYDGEIKKVGKGSNAFKVYNNTIAVYRNEDATDFINFSVSGEKSIDFVSDHFKKGSPIEITGSINIDKVGEGKDSKYYTNIRVSRVYFPPKTKE